MPFPLEFAFTGKHQSKGFQLNTITQLFQIPKLKANFLFVVFSQVKNSMVVFPYKTSL